MAKMEWNLRGVIVPLITPFKEDLSIDYAGLAELVDYCIEEVGCDGLVPCGTTGESPTLSHEEHIDVIKAVVQQTRKRVPVIASSGSNATREAVHLTKLAAEAGADASLQVGPYYNKPTQEGLFNHFAAIAAAADLPMIIYNIPGRTCRNIEPQTIARLWREIPAVVGLKDCSNDLHQTMSIYRSTDPETFKIYCGEDIMTFALLCHGGAGRHRGGGARRRSRGQGHVRGGLERAPRGSASHPLSHHGRGRRPLRRAEPDAGQAGYGMAGSACRSASASARAHDAGRSECASLRDAGRGLAGLSAAVGSKRRPPLQPKTDVEGLPRALECPCNPHGLKRRSSCAR